MRNGVRKTMEPEAAESYMRRVYSIRAIVIMVMAAVIWYTKVGYYLKNKAIKINPGGNAAK
ncbi:MAG: hypothetical protein LUF35_11275 [Lachnospiraceae bacterium]|nr:hypothetical protein [Lachnospiraceae bacterium]